MKTKFLLGLFLLCMQPLHAQLVDGLEDESKLYASSKQVNQFFRRFNGEEDEKGNRYYPQDKPYRSPNLRKKYLSILFDNSNISISGDLKVAFAKDVLRLDAQSILTFQNPGWFSQVQADFTLNGKTIPITLFMGLEKDHLGHKWVIQKIRADAFTPYFARDTTKIGKFLHPLSHELDFMNLRKAFDQKDSVSQFASKQFEPDHLSIFLYDIKRGNLKFKAVTDVKFHFFQVDGWYFELAQFNREGYNTGWLISNLVRVNNDTEKKLLKTHLYK